MKIKSTLAMIFVALFMASCDKEGNDPKVLDFSGSYEGYTLASSSYFQNMVSAGEIISIAENPDGTASVSFTSATWGEFTIADAQANMSGSLCTLAGSGQARMGMGGNTSSYECSFTAEIKSQSEARMTFEIPAVRGGMKIEFTTGNAPADLLLAGTYAGYTDADCLYFQDRYTDGESMTLTANGDGTVKVVFESASWGTFSVESAAADMDGSYYVFTGSGSVAMGMGESTNSYDFTLNGRTNAAKDDFSIVFNVPAVMGGLTVTLLPGSAPAANE